MIFLAERGNQLIHDSTVTAYKLVFCFLTVKRDLCAVQRQMIKLLQYGSDRDFQ